MLSSIIIGGGPGGMGPLLWAAQNGQLTQWLAQGVAVIDRRDGFGGTLGRYAINSDSLGGAYLECLDAPLAVPELRRLRNDPATRELAVYRDGFPPLRLVDRYLQRLGATLDQLLGTAAHSRLHRSSDARALHLMPDGSVRVDLVDGEGRRTSLNAHSAVIALGGRQIWADRPLVEGLTLAACPPANIIPSDRLLARDGLQEAAAILAASPGRPVVILGGSHSAYSVAWALAFLLPKGILGTRPITILQRREPKVFYPDHESASAEDYPVQPGDICPRTNRVHRLGGLRGDGRDMWRIITGRAAGPDGVNVTVNFLHDMSAKQLQQTMAEAALVVPAFGYCARTLPILDQYGRRLALQADSGGDGVDQECRVLLKDGRALANVFGIGLGTGFRPCNEMGGEPNFSGQANSLWLYQNGIGALVHRNIQRVVTMGQSATIVSAHWDGRTNASRSGVISASAEASRAHGL
jgi:hypothetical protein